MLPNGWTVESFETIARFAAGRTPSRANPVFWQGLGPHYPWVTISDMEDYGTITTTAESVTQAAFDQVFRGRLVRAGTLIMSFKLTIGRIGTLGVDAFHNEAIISIYPKLSVDQRYLGYFLSQIDYTEHQDRQVKGNTLNQDKLNRILVNLPPETEQSRIADVLDCVRKAILLQGRLTQKAHELKR